MERQIREKIFESYYEKIINHIDFEEVLSIKTNKEISIIIPFASSKGDRISQFDKEGKCIKEYHKNKYIFYDDFPKLKDNETLYFYLSKYKRYGLYFEIKDNSSKVHKGIVYVWYKVKNVGVN